LLQEFSLWNSCIFSWFRKKVDEKLVLYFPVKFLLYAVFLLEQKLENYWYRPICIDERSLSLAVCGMGIILSHLNLVFKIFISKKRWKNRVESLITFEIISIARNKSYGHIHPNDRISFHKKLLISDQWFKNNQRLSEIWWFWWKIYDFAKNVKWMIQKWPVSEIFSKNPLLISNR
jgi:hypothetical protein